MEGKRRNPDERWRLARAGDLCKKIEHTGGVRGKATMGTRPEPDSGKNSAERRFGPRADGAGRSRAAGILRKW